jgi:hypothetical protein
MRGVPNALAFKKQAARSKTSPYFYGPEAVTEFVLDRVPAEKNWQKPSL